MKELPQDEFSKELIRTFKNEDGVTVVDGRDLHEFLKVETPYRKWFPRMVEYGFIENTDFITFGQKSPIANGGYKEIENHALTLDMAKELSMIQRTKKGKQARRYFIHMEKVANHLPQTPEEKIALLLQNAGGANKELKKVDERVTNLEDTMRVSGVQEQQLQMSVKKRVLGILGGKESLAYEKLGSSIFKQCWHDFKRHFQIPRYGELPRIKFNEGIRYIEAWLPDTENRLEISNCNAQGELFD